MPSGASPRKLWYTWPLPALSRWEVKERWGGVGLYGTGCLFEEPNSSCRAIRTSRKNKATNREEKATSGGGSDQDPESGDVAFFLNHGGRVHGKQDRFDLGF